MLIFQGVCSGSSQLMNLSHCLKSTPSSREENPHAITESTRNWVESTTEMVMNSTSKYSWVSGGGQWHWTFILYQQKINTQTQNDDRSSVKQQDHTSQQKTYVLTKLKKTTRQTPWKKKTNLFPNQKRTNPAAFFFGTRLNSVFWTPVPVWSGIRLQDSKKRAMDVTQRKPGGCGPNTWKAKMGEFFVKKHVFWAIRKNKKPWGFHGFFLPKKCETD